MNTNRLQWKIGGEAGFGIMTTGLIFSRACIRGGLKTFAYPEYPSLIRGGHNTYQTMVDAEQATSPIKDVHLLVALNSETIALHVDELLDGSAVVYDPDDFKEGAPVVAGKNIIFVPVPLSAIVKKHEANRVARNTISLGASFGLLGYPWEIVEGVIHDWFGRKKPEVAEANIALTKEGYDLVAGKYPQYAYALVPQKATPQMVISGNGSVAMGAVKAGMKFYAAYPMTPSSDILGYLARQEEKMGLVVKHTEDEIAAMNMIIGAGFAGVRAMTGTSGGGFALMVEALGMAGIAEVPCVVVMGQRPGPSTGLPTWTCQADLRFVLHASQGEFPRIVLTPGDAQECFYATFEAFNLSEKYQTPVIVLVDKMVQESWQSVVPYDTSMLSVNRGKLLTQEELNEIVRSEGKYYRHEHAADGISRRALPGMEGGRHIDSSYEHDPSGYTTEDPTETTAQMDKRFRKMETFLKEDVKGPMFYGPENADVTMVGWGSTKLVALEAVRMAAASGVSLNYLHFVYIDPLPVDAVRAAFAKTKKTLCVEGNKLGQLEGWLRENADVRMTAHIRKYNGRPFFPEEILERAKSL
jgi:2-oxoglutarate ferredoxin oxidoreductase subunit alpha